MIKIKVLIFILIEATSAQAQEDFGWGRHWTAYTQLTSMGPNTLPVPDSKKGVLPLQSEFKIAGEGHFSDGDNTQNLFGTFYMPLFSNRVGFQLEMVPLELYKLHDETRAVSYTHLTLPTILLV